MAAHKLELQAFVASRSKKIFLFCFLGLEYFVQRFNQPVDKNGQKFFDPFFDPPGDFFGQKKGGYWGELGGVFGSNAPLALLIDP